MSVDSVCTVDGENSLFWAILRGVTAGSVFLWSKLEALVEGPLRSPHATELWPSVVCPSDPTEHASPHQGRRHALAFLLGQFQQNLTRGIVLGSALGYPVQHPVQPD